MSALTRPSNIPAFVPPKRFREDVVEMGNTKFWALVKAGKIVMADFGVGRRFVDVDATLKLNAN